MRIVIQCAGSKHVSAGSFTAPDKKLIKFVANPNSDFSDKSYAYARPDDAAGNGQTWRERLLAYNTDHAEQNPDGLLQACQLYKKPIYMDLTKKFGVKNLFILSAGWGLISANFLTPDYDITFSNIKGQPHVKRGKLDNYSDFNMLPDNGEAVTFLGGKSYLPMFYRLLAQYSGAKNIIYNSINEPILPTGFKAIRYKTKARTNWHYKCGQSIIDGTLKL